MRTPNNTLWRTNWASDRFGDAVRTRNIDFNELGYLKLARKPTVLFSENTGVSETGDADFQDTVAIANDGTYYYVVTTDHIFGLTLSGTTIAVGEVSTGSAPTVVETSDAVLYKGAIAVTGSTTLHSLAGFDGSGGSGTWTNRSLSLSSSYPHPMERFENRRTLCVASGNIVYQTAVDSWTDDSTNRLTLPAEYTVTTMRWQGNKMYIGTRANNGGNAMVFLWNGATTSAQAGYPVNADWVYCATPHASSVAFLLSTGQLVLFNGGGFSELSALPVYYSPYSWTENATGQSRGKAINRGIWSNGRIIYFTIQGEVRGNIEGFAHRQPGGLWVHDPDAGIYHKSGFNTEPYRILSISSLQSNVFNFSSAHELNTGDPVFAYSVSNIAALTAGHVYYAIVDTTTSIRLALSVADAERGDPITCTGTISGDKLAVDDTSNLGSVARVDPGPVIGFNEQIPSLFFASEVLFCGSSYNAAGNDQSAVMSLGLARNVGNFITPKYYSPNIEDTMKKLLVYIRDVLKEDDLVVVKYRTRERLGVPTPLSVSGIGPATWVDGNTFTVTLASKDVRSVINGDEIEIVSGAGAGRTAHISSIEKTSTVWTFNLDESIPLITANDTSDFIADNWIKLATISKDNILYKEVGLGKKYTWIQFKIELRGRDVAIPMMDSIGEVFKFKV